VASPDELQAKHWFELEVTGGATAVRHTVEGYASGRYEVIWRERIQPLHDLILEALLDNIEAEIAPVAHRNVWPERTAGRQEMGWAGRRSADSLREAVTSREEVRPMNAVSRWVLPLFVTVGRLT
jgi:hypothetical protein